MRLLIADSGLYFVTLDQSELSVNWPTSDPHDLFACRLYTCCTLTLTNKLTLAAASEPNSVFENTYFTFFRILRDFLCFFWNDVSKSRKKSLAKVLVLNPSKWVDILRSVITVIRFSYLFVSLLYLRTFIHLSHTVLSCTVSCECEHYVQISGQRCLMLVTCRYWFSVNFY